MGKFDVRPSPLLTKELLFLGESGNIGGGSGGPMFRAYDKRDGKVVWEAEMPTLVTGAPMTYELNGRQYVVVAVSKRGRRPEMVALTLDGASENGAAPAGGVPLAAAPPSSHAGAALAVNATPEELALGKTMFDQVCAICHGPNGVGMTRRQCPAARPTVRTTPTSLASSPQGQGEMPSLAAALTPAQIEAIAKYVVKTLGPQPPTGARPARPPPDMRGLASEAKSGHEKSG